MAKHTLFITSPLEPEYVEHIRAVDPARLEVIHQPDLLPPTAMSPTTRWTVHAHAGADQRWREAIAAADILWDCPPPTADGPGDIVHARRLKWVQTTSSGVGHLVRKLGLDKTDVIVTTARGAHSGPLAEFTFMALLMHFRKLHFLEAEQRAHRWVRYCDEEVQGERSSSSAPGTSRAESPRSAARSRCVSSR